MLRIDPAVRRRWPSRRRWGSGSSSCCARSRTSYDAATSSRSTGDPVVRRRLARGRRGRAGRQLRRRRAEEPAPRCRSGGRTSITLQPVRAGFPCFGAALAGYVEATRADGDAEKNRLCPPSSFGNSLTDWATDERARACAQLGRLRRRARHQGVVDRVALNPARVPPEHPGSPALDDALERLQTHAGPGVARLAELSSPAWRQRTRDLSPRVPLARNGDVRCPVAPVAGAGAEGHRSAGGRRDKGWTSWPPGSTTPTTAWWPVRFADDVRGDVIVSVDQRGGTGLRLISEHDPAGETTNYVIPGAFTDRRAEGVRCPGFRARWLEDRPVVRMAMPSRCLDSGDYGAIRFAVLTERGDDTDYASGVPDEGSAWIPRG